jgi:hypothetical protein
MSNLPKKTQNEVGKPPKVVRKVVDEGEGRRQMLLNAEAMPGRGEDDLLLLLTNQVLDATKINAHTEAQATERYNATIAAFHNIGPVGALQGMLATQLIACHMATMDCYGHLNRTHDRITHEYHLNQVNKLSRSYVALLEAFNRQRGKAHQKVTVEHVHVHQGGQAIVGHVEHKREGVDDKKE